MTTSSSSAASQPQTRSEWVSTLPPWRRLLAMLNWRPVYDIEQRTKQLRIETERLNTENKCLAVLESRLDFLLLNADSSSQTPPATGSN
jgi:ribosomal protein S4